MGGGGGGKGRRANGEGRKKELNKGEVLLITMIMMTAA
jgi:hypothetical protein